MKLHNLVDCSELVSNIMRPAAATIVLPANISYDPRPLPSCHAHRNINWLCTISQIIGELNQCNLTLNYLPTEHELCVFSGFGSFSRD